MQCFFFSNCPFSVDSLVLFGKSFKISYNKVNNTTYFLDCWERGIAYVRMWASLVFLQLFTDISISILLNFSLLMNYVFVLFFQSTCVIFCCYFWFHTHLHTHTKKKIFLLSLRCFFVYIVTFVCVTTTVSFLYILTFFDFGFSVTFVTISLLFLFLQFSSFLDL